MNPNASVKQLDLWSALTVILSLCIALGISWLISIPIGTRTDLLELGDLSRSKNIWKLWGVREERGLQVVVAVYGFAILISQAVMKARHNSELTVYGECGIALLLAALVSLIFDLTYHEEHFIKPVGEITTDLIKLSTSSATITKALDNYNRISGLIDYREEIRQEFCRAETRVVSVADYWFIDKDWWEGVLKEPVDAMAKQIPKVTQSCALFKSLTSDDAKAQPFGARQSPPREIIFVGGVPYPPQTTPWPHELRHGSLALIDNSEPCHQLNVAFDGKHFGRMLGTAWRLMIAHEVRKYWKDNRGDGYCTSVEVVVANVPVPVTVVDNQVFLLLQTKDMAESRGTRVTVQDYDPTGAARDVELFDADALRNQKLADAHYYLVKGYLSHARSAREYIASMLSMANQSATGISRDEGLMISISRCLTVLGIDDWLSWISLGDTADDFPSKYRYNSEQIRRAAILIFAEVIKSLSYLPSGTDGGPTFANLRDDLL